MEQEYKYMVCTSCMTYNHAPYIVDAMNGFTMQETTFPVYYLITDDASADGEPEVIKQYLAEHFQAPYRTEETDDYHLICAVHKTNPNCIFIVFFLKYNHYSIKKTKLPYQSEWRDNAKYIALCEGDDYWTDSEKIQRQVAYLNQNCDCVAVAENGMELNIITKRERLFNSTTEQETDYKVEDLLLSRRFPTASVLYRSELIRNDKCRNMRYKHDTAMWCYFASVGKLRFVNINSSVYRRGSGITVTTGRLKWAQTTEQWYLYLLNYFKEYISDRAVAQIEKLIYFHYLIAATDGIRRHDKKERKEAIRRLKELGISSHVELDVFLQYMKDIMNNMKLKIRKLF